jgi:hypothetical protein
MFNIINTNGRMITAGFYAMWGFYSGFNGFSHYLDVKPALYIDRTLIGIYSGAMYVVLAPLSIVQDMRLAESYVRGLNEETTDITHNQLRKN